MERSQSAKRKFPLSGLQRRVRARKEEPELDPEDQYGESSKDGSDNEEASEPSDHEEASQSDSSADDEDNVSEEDYAAPANPSLAASQVSFGALAKAQASLPNARRKNQKQQSSGSEPGSSEEDSSFEAEERHKPNAKKPQGRANKHAPAEQSSKRAVTRKREVVAVHKVAARDPRFGPSFSSSPHLTTASLNEEAVRRNYAFLNEYRDSEMAQLKTSIKKTKEPAAKEQLQRALASMQSKKQAQKRKDTERAVVAEHRRSEKELVKQGKQPFYLKRAEQKKRVLVDRFAGLKKRQVDKVIERKRKKIASKERRELPFERRER
ncbi:hypothetical protein BJ170DRAFT_293741 [Xylariales sp. AK1849]|nr:hypothetical protein BJ170DRAFT_293741 [Xylariales sp. AK1849]